MTLDFKNMTYFIEHNTKDYIRGKIILWLFKLYKRFTLQRRSLRLGVVFVQIILYLVLKKWSVIFLLLIGLIIIIDFFITVIDVIREKKNMDFYIKSGGEKIEFIINEDYLAFKQYHKLFHITNWNDLNEIYVLKNPSLISFKNKRTKHDFILYENESYMDYSEIKDIILKRSKVKPLLDN